MHAGTFTFVVVNRYHIRRDLFDWGLYTKTLREVLHSSSFGTTTAAVDYYSFIAFYFRREYPALISY